MRSNRNIRVWGYIEEYHKNKDSILRAVDEVFESGVLILGNKGKQFVSAYANYCGV